MGHIWSRVQLVNDTTMGCCCTTKLADEVNQDKLSRSQVRSSTATYTWRNPTTGQYANIPIKLSLLNDGSIIKLAFPDSTILNAIYPNESALQQLVNTHLKITKNGSLVTEWSIIPLSVENNSITLTIAKEI